MMANYKFEGCASVALPELTLGDRGHAVATVQVMLCTRGYYIPEETAGVFDRNTEEAVCAFQKDSGMTITGTVTDGTWAWLILMD